MITLAARNRLVIGALVDAEAAAEAADSEPITGSVMLSIKVGWNGRSRWWVGKRRAKRLGGPHRFGRLSLFS